MAIIESEFVMHNLGDKNLFIYNTFLTEMILAIQFSLFD